MTNTSTFKMVEFLGHKYNVAFLKAAIATAATVAIDKKIKLSKEAFPDFLPEEWKAKQKIPVVTMANGEYVFIWIPNEMKVDQVTNIKLVSKYNLNKARHVEPPPVDTTKPIYEAPAPIVRRPFNPPRVIVERPSPGRPASQFGQNQAKRRTGSN